MSWHGGLRLAASTDCRFFTVDVNVPLKELGHRNREKSTQTHHSRYAIPICCIIAALWPNDFHHAGTITARSDCLELNKRSWGGFCAYNPFWMRCRSCGMQTLKKSMTPLSVFGNSRMDEFSPLHGVWKLWDMSCDFHSKALFQKLVCCLHSPQWAPNAIAVV